MRSTESLAAADREAAGAGSFVFDSIQIRLRGDIESAPSLTTVSSLIGIRSTSSSVKGCRRYVRHAFRGRPCAVHRRK